MKLSEVSGAPKLKLSQVMQTAEPSMTDSLKRGAGVFARDVASGLAALPLAAADLGTGVVNVGRRALGAEPWPSASENFQAGLDAAGLPRAESGGEQLVSAATRGAVGAGSFAGAARELAPAASGAARGVYESLAANPGLQLASGASAGASGEVARQEGVGPLGQTVASVAGGLAPAVASTARQSLFPAKVAASSIADDTAKAAREAGFTIPPVQTNPSLLNRTLEGFSGKISTAQASAVKNQEVTNRLARQAIGLADDIPITPDALSAVRAEAGKAYEAVKQAAPIINADKAYLKTIGDLQKGASGNAFKTLDNKTVQELASDFGKTGFSGDEAVEAAKQLRFEGKANTISLDPKIKAQGKAQLKIADALENLIDRNLQQQQPGLVDAYRAARTQIAKTYTIEGALNPSTGNVIAGKLGKAFSKGKPLSGGLEEVGRFAAAYPRAAQEITSSMPGASPLDWMAGAGLSAATSNPLAMLSVASRPAARALILSRLYQNGPGAPTGLARPPMRLNAISPGAAPLVTPLERLQAQ